ncbi:probable glutamate receptor [Panulirus ornatus]|uniref:probable glutamate receptor n=1 Tax=Panulirus ornatus TaxID=150431 RepID=UPI003A859172
MGGWRPCSSRALALCLILVIPSAGATTTPETLPKGSPFLRDPPAGGAHLLQRRSVGSHATSLALLQGVPDMRTPQPLQQERMNSPAIAPHLGLLAFFRKKTQQEEEEEALGSLLTTIVTRELQHCSLTVAVDDGLDDSPAVRRVLQLPNLRQVLRVRTWEDYVGLLWERSGCRGYLLLLRDPTPLLTFADMGEDPWDFSGRYVVVGMSTEQLQQLTSSRKGRKTEHILGLLQAGGAGEWEVLLNQLYSRSGVRRVTTWRSTTFTNDHLLFPDKMADLQGAALKVVTFQFAPHMMESASEGGQRYGRDLQLVTALANVLNVTLTFQLPPSGELWGRKLVDDSWTGLVGSLARQEADLGVANIFLSNNNNRRLVQDFTRFYDADVSCFLARKEPPLASWQSLALPFTLHTWLAILAGLGLTSLALFFIASASGREVESLQEVVSAALYSWGIHLRVSQERVPRGVATQVLVLVMLVYAIILTTGYSCNLTAYLTVVRSPPSMDTLRQLHASSQRVLGIGPFFKVSMASSTNIYLQELTERYVSHSSFQEALVSVQDGTGVFIESRKFLEYLMNTQFTSHGTSAMRIMKECFAPYSIAIALQKHSPLKPKLDQALSWIFESGLVRRWFLDSLMRTRQLEQRKTAGEGDSSGGGGEGVALVPLGTQHLQGIFLALLIGLSLSCLTLLAELTCRPPHHP